jgi:hypothetical protein
MLVTQVQWRNFGSLHLARHYFEAIAIRPTQVLVMGGFTQSTSPQQGEPTNECEIIDIQQRQVFPAAPLNVRRAEFVALLSSDSNVVVLGGVMSTVSSSGGSGKLTPTVELYDRSSNQWRIIGNLQIPRRQHCAIWLDYERILVVGGRHEDLTTMAEAEIFDIRTGTSQIVSPYPYTMTDLLSGHTSTGIILVWGGRIGGPNSFRTDEVYEYNGTNWRLFQRLPEQFRGGVAIQLWDNRLLTAGGSYFESPTFNFVRSVYIENNGRLQRFSDSLSIGRSSCGLAQWDSTTVLVVGGFQGGITPSPTNTCEWIDLRNGLVLPAPSLIESRAHYRVVSLSNSSYQVVLAISGYSTNRNTPTIEILERKCPERAVTITGARSLCPGDTLLLSADSGFVRYRWSTGDTTRSLRISSPGTYTVTATDADSCTATGDVTVTAAPGAILLHTRSTPAHVPIGTIWCDTVELLNPSDVPLLLDSLWLARNVEWSLPLHQLPLELAPGERRTLLVCWSSWARGEHRDTLVLTTPCGIKLLPLALLATDIQWKAHSSCGVTIESILADDAMTTLITAAHLVRIRDLVGRVVFEHIGDGQATPIAIPGGLRPGIYLLERDEVRSLLLVRQ